MNELNRFYCVNALNAKIKQGKMLSIGNIFNLDGQYEPDNFKCLAPGSEIIKFTRMLSTCNRFRYYFKDIQYR